MDFLHNILDPIFLIKTVGFIGILFIIFAESGLFFGFFFPGDSLLFTAGFLASQDYMPILGLLILCPIMAILGDNFGYFFGRKSGPLLFTKEDSFFFKKAYVEKARLFYEKHGKKTIIFARFIPIVRTFAPIVAGIGEMNYKIFVPYNIIGGLIWTLGMVSLGYFLGNIIPNAGHYLTYIIIVIILFSFAPAIPSIWRHIRMKV